MGIHIPYKFPINWGAKELLGVSQPNDSYVVIGKDQPNMGYKFQEQCYGFFWVMIWSFYGYYMVNDG